MAGVSTGSSALLAALASRARLETNETTDGVSMAIGDEFPKIGDPKKIPVETRLHLAAAAWRTPVAETAVESTNAYTAALEIALLAAHERAVQRMAMSRMRTIAAYRLRLKSRPNLLQRGIAEGLVPL